MSYDNSKGTAPNVQNLDMLSHDCPRSSFDWSCIEDTTVQIGAITPIDLMEVDINSDVKANYNILALLRNPLAKQLLSGMRVYLHAFYAPKRYLWEGYEVHYTKGRRGDIVKDVPRILLRDNNYHDGEQTGTQNDYATPLSLADHLGIPITSCNLDITDKNTWFTRLVIKDAYDGEYKDYYNNVNCLDSYSAPDLPSGGFCANALPFVMYQKLCRSNFFATDLLMKNKEWYPDFDDHFRLPYDIPTYEWDEANKQFTTYKSNNYVNVLSHDNPTWSKASLDMLDWTPDGSVYVPSESTDSTKESGGIPQNEVPVVLTALHFRQFRGDYFNTSLPYPDLIRGDIPTVEQLANLDFSDVFSTFEQESTMKGIPVGSGFMLMGIMHDSNEEVNKDFLTAMQSGDKLEATDSGLGFGITNGEFSRPASNSKLKAVFERAKVNSTLTRNMLNQMLVATAMKERMARTDGSFNQINTAMFNYNPHVEEYDPIYIGGAYMDLQLSNVVQTSKSDSDSQLGDAISRGLAMGELNFNYHCNEPGYIMVVAEVVPDVYYTNQGIDKLWTNTSAEDVYFPIQNNLGPVAIRNKELFMSRTASDNDDVFGYTERGADKRSRRNKLSGLFALPSTLAEDDSRQHMKRHFDSLPKLNNEFVTMSPKNIDMEVFLDQYDVPFNFSVAKNVTYVGPRPYSSMPNALGLKY